MSANFLNLWGSFMGIDQHTFIMLVPSPAPIPAPIPLQPHGVAHNHLDVSRRWRIATTVTMSKSPVLQNNWAMLGVMHIPLAPLVPHPTEAPWLAVIILGSSSTPQLSAHKVTGQGQALLTEIAGSKGVNLDCTDGFTMAPDVNLNSVVTQPTLGDYIAAALSAVGNYWLGKFYGMGGLPLAVITNLLDGINSQMTGKAALLIGDPGADAINVVTGAIQRAIDGEPVYQPIKEQMAQ
jgi:hypothetical protein